ncbi:hypothetical protein D3C76_1180170 [compost metagenome]
MLWTMNFLQQTKKLLEKARTAQKAAVRVIYILIYFLLISGEPIEWSLNWKKPFIEVAECNGVQQQTSMFFPLKPALKAGDLFADG